MSVALECGAVPMRELRSGFVSALTEIQDGLGGNRRGAHILVFQKKLAQLTVPTGGGRTHRFLSQPRGSRRGIGIVSRMRIAAVARPESTTDYFVRVGLAGQRIGI